MKHLKISFQKHKISSLLLLSKCMTNYMKTSFLHAHFTETMEKVENLFYKSKLIVNSSFIEKTYVVGTHWNCLTEAIPRCIYNILLKIRKTILKFTFIPSIMSIVFASFKHLKLPISIKMPVAILHIVYVCMTATAPNYFFANLVFAWC